MVAKRKQTKKTRPSSNYGIQLTAKKQIKVAMKKL